MKFSLGYRVVLLHVAKSLAKILIAITTIQNIYDVNYNKGNLAQTIRVDKDIDKHQCCLWY